MIIGTPIWESAPSHSQKVWEMITVANKIACCSYAACLPAIILRLAITDSITFTTVYNECVKALHNWQKYGKFCYMIVDD